MDNNSTSRMAKNTIFLYIRMLVSLVITLYTSRVVLSILGEEDFGIYNVVGGVVVLFSFLTSAMTNSTQRFLNFNLGLKDTSMVANVFSTSMLAHISILGVVFVLAETIGLWFVMTQLNIPQDRFISAVWVYQASVLITLLNIIIVPYRASIIATEQMDLFALLSIVEVIFKLLIVLILPCFSIDSLILYSVLLSVVSFLMFLIYKEICRKKIFFAQFNFVWNKTLYFELMSFSGWYLFGGVAVVGAKQGSNIIINIFYNVAVNAAVGVANQVRTAVYGFVSSFQTAFNPQIVKLYASRQFEQMINLIYNSSKLSYYLLFILSLPIIVFCQEVLSIWLVSIPDYTVIFTQLIVLTSFTEALSAPLWTAIGAVGKIQKYQIWVSVIMLLDLPIVYIVFKLGYSPIWAFIVNLLISILAYIYRLLYIKKYIPYKLLFYLKQVLLPCIFVTALSLPIPMFLHAWCNTFASTCVAVLLTILQSCMMVYLIGLNKQEKAFIINKFIQIIKKK